MNVEWTERALTEYRQIQNYILENWGMKATDQFEIRLSENIARLANQPYMHPQYGPKKQIRRCVLHKNTSLFYQVDFDTIRLLGLVNNRRNPEDLKF